MKEKVSADVIDFNITRKMSNREIEQKKTLVLSRLEREWKKLKFRPMIYKDEKILLVLVNAPVGTVEFKSIARGMAEMAVALKIKCEIIVLPKSVDFRYQELQDFINLLNKRQIEILKKILDKMEGLT